MEYFKNNNIVVFGMGRSGTNALSEKLALEYYKDTHLYIKEPFSINEYNISFHFMYFNIDHCLSKVIQLKNESDYRSYVNNNFGNNDFSIASKTKLVFVLFI